MHSQSVILLSRNALVANQAGTEGGWKTYVGLLFKNQPQSNRDKCENFFENQMEEHYFGRCVGPYDYFFVFFVDGCNCSGEMSNLQLFCLILYPPHLYSMAMSNYWIVGKLIN